MGSVGVLVQALLALLVRAYLGRLMTTPFSGWVAGRVSEDFGKPPTMQPVCNHVTC